jgi:hypothetical protein
MNLNDKIFLSIVNITGMMVLVAIFADLAIQGKLTFGKFCAFICIICVCLALQWIMIRTKSADRDEK